MSLLQCYNQSFSSHTVVHNVESSKLVNDDKVVNGIIVTDYVFKTQKLSDDARQSLKYQDLCLGNLQKLGVTGQLQHVMLQRNDVDLVINQIDSINEKARVEVPAETK